MCPVWEIVSKHELDSLRITRLLGHPKGQYASPTFFIYLTSLPLTTEYMQDLDLKGHSQQGRIAFSTTCLYRNLSFLSFQSGLFGWQNSSADNFVYICQPWKITLHSACSWKFGVMSISAKTYYSFVFLLTCLLLKYCSGLFY